MPALFALLFLIASFLPVLKAGGQHFRAVYSMKLEGTRDPDFIITEEMGCLLGWFPDRVTSKNQGIRIKGLDLQLKPLWEGFFQVKPEYDLRFSEQDFTGGGVWLVFQDRQQTGSSLLLKINYANGAYESRKVTFPFDMDIHDVIAGKDGLYFKGFYHNKPVVAFSNFDEQFVRVLPYISQKNTTLCNIGLDSSGQELAAIVRTRVGPKKEKAELRTYRNGFFTGTLKQITNLKDRKQPHFVSRLKEQDTCWVGTWTTPAGETSQGFLSIVGSRIVQPTYLLNDTAFGSLFSSARQKRMRKISGERKDRFLQYRYRHHPLVTRGTTNLLLMEAYYERSNQSYSFPPFNPTGPNTPSFRHYYFDHLMLAHFSENGTLERTAAIKLPGVTSQELTPQAVLAGDTVILVRKNEACLFANPTRPETEWREYPPEQLGLANSSSPSILGLVQEGSFVYCWGTYSGKDGKYFFVSKLRE